MGKSTAKRTPRKAVSKPKKPRPDFPLFPHASGRWAKKVRGKFRYLGKIADDPEGVAALEMWLERGDTWRAGREWREGGDDELQLRDLANHFLTAKRRLVDSGDIVTRTLVDYHSVCERTLEFFGKNRLASDLIAADFERFRSHLAKTMGPVALGNFIARVRIMFKYGYDQGLLDRPMRYGQGFQKPSRAVLRKARAKAGPRMFEAKQIQAMLRDASVPLKAMILLGINAGLGNSDVGNLREQHLDLKTNWMDYPRPKTGVARRVWLWPETVKAMKAAIAARPTPKDKADRGRVFVTVKGLSWSKERADNPVSKEFTKLLKSLKLHEKGVGFYCLRRTFETIASGSLDQPSVDHIMGHAPAANDMSAVYRQFIDDKRLKKVSEHVRRWLFPKPKKKGGKKAKR